MSSLAVVFLSMAGLVAAVPFPGRAREAPDPTGHYAVVWSEATGDEPHHLTLVSKASKVQRPLTTFPRHVSVLWDPDGTALAVTNWEGSNYSSIQIYFVEESREPVSIPAALTKALGDLPEVTQNLHVYFEAIEWRDRATLVFRLRAYGDNDPAGFTRTFECDLAGEIKPLQGKAEE